MTTRSPLLAKRQAFFTVFALPQLLVLLMFVMSRYVAWLDVATHATGFFSFFFDAVSAGLGWPLLSLGVFAASLSFHHFFGVDLLKAELEDGLQNFHGSKVHEDYLALMREHVRFNRIVLFVVVAIGLCAGASIVGAVLSTTPYTVDVPTLIAVVAVGLAANCTFDTPTSWESHVKRAYQHWPSTVEMMLQLHKADMAGHIDTDLLQSTLAAMKKHMASKHSREYRQYLEQTGQPLPTEAPAEVIDAQ